MRFPKTSLAVALIATTLSLPAVAAQDMHHDQAAPAMNHDAMRHDDHGAMRHKGWHRHGWHQHCWTRWHHHRAVRVCR